MLSNNMEEFNSDVQSALKPTPGFSELSSSLELLNSFSELNQPLLNSQFLGYFSNDYHSILNNASSSQPPPYSNEQLQFHFPENGAFDHTPATRSHPSPVDGGEVGTTEITTTEKQNKIGGRKRKRKNEEVKKPKEVIHVRAKRGQATDSHSLAERVRREKINDKLRVLQDLVPGCYKTMGMAVMLDVIINYVRSLQNQIEFLSMKLSAASMFYDFNSPEAEAIETLQRTTTTATTTITTTPYDFHEVDRVEREGHGGMLPRHNSIWPF